MQITDTLLHKVVYESNTGITHRFYGVHLSSDGNQTHNLSYNRH